MQLVMSIIVTSYNLLLKLPCIALHCYIVDNIFFQTQKWKNHIWTFYDVINHKQILYMLTCPYYCASLVCIFSLTDFLYTTALCRMLTQHWAILIIGYLDFPKMEMRIKSCGSWPLMNSCFIMMASSMLLLRRLLTPCARKISPLYQVCMLYITSC